jgi:two-component system, sensor histidine kinase and response regulator
MSRVFNGSELLERIDNDWDFLSETVEMLQTDGRALLDQIRAAADAGDAAAVSRAGHTLKGMISNFCSPSAQSAAFEVERIGKSGDLSAAPEAIKALKVQLDALIASLTDFLATRPA